MSRTFLASGRTHGRLETPLRQPVRAARFISGNPFPCRVHTLLIVDPVIFLSLSAIANAKGYPGPSIILLKHNSFSVTQSSWNTSALSLSPSYRRPDDTSLHWKTSPSCCMFSRGLHHTVKILRFLRVPSSTASSKHSDLL